MPKRLTLFLFVFFFSLLSFFSINDIYAKYNRTSREKIITPTASQKVKPTSTPTPTLRITKTPTPTKLPIKRSLPTIISTAGTSSSPSTDSKKNFIIGKINEYRKSQGYLEVSSEKYTCEFASIRAEEISKNFNHDGFRSRINNKSLPYPGYKSVTENIAMNSDYTKVVDAWINSPSHAENMRKDTPRVCVEFFGNYYAYEGWRP